MAKIKCPRHNCNSGHIPCTGYGCQQGQIKCDTCDGTALVKCPRCGGDGSIEHGSQYEGCPGCGGRGVGDSYAEITRGSGQVRCTASGCHGGKVPCPTCRGEGHLNCPLCGGSGEVDDPRG